MTQVVRYARPPAQRDRPARPHDDARVRRGSERDDADQRARRGDDGDLPSRQSDVGDDAADGAAPNQHHDLRRLQPADDRSPTASAHDNDRLRRARRPDAASPTSSVRASRSRTRSRACRSPSTTPTGHHAHLTYDAAGNVTVEDRLARTRHAGDLRRGRSPPLPRPPPAAGHDQLHLLPPGLAQHHDPERRRLQQNLYDVNGNVASSYDTPRLHTQTNTTFDALNHVTQISAVADGTDRQLHARLPRQPATHDR